jgi:transcriptional regulator PpsR
MNNLVKTFDARVGALAEADGHSIAAIIAAAADVALIIDANGIVRDIAFNDGDAQLEQSRAWLGQVWADTVTVESRTKVEGMLAEVREEGVSRRRQVNHPLADGPDLAVAYTAVRLGRSGNVAAIGRDLRALGQLQQRLVEVQQTLERDYWRMRHIETRYRLLFQLSAEAVMVVDAHTMKVVEANPAAALLFGGQARAMIGKTFPFGLEAAGHRAATEYLASIRTAGRADPVRVNLTSGGRVATLSAALVRQDSSTLFLVRLLPEDVESVATSSTANARVVDLIESAPDGFVVADLEGRVLTANRAFLDLAQLATQEQARGQSIAQWIGRPGADLQVLLTTLREHGVVRLFSTTVRGEYGSTAEVELSAVAAPNGEEPCIGITMRDVGRRLATGPQGARDLTRAVEQLTGLVGRVSLRDLVRDTVDLVERHFIEAALELTHDNRTSAAEVLGVSRQSLYVKLRRYNLGNAQPDTEVS